MEYKILVILVISMVVITVSSNPLTEAVVDQQEMQSMLELEDFEVHPTNVKCVLMGPKEAEDTLLRKKRSAIDNQFKFGILGLANVDLITSVLDDKTRGKSPVPVNRPSTTNRRLLELMIKNGR